MKKSLGLIATVALAFSPVAVFAQEVQTNIQGASNSGAAIGTGNFVNQNIDQTSFQDQLQVDGYYYGADPQVQMSVQDASNSGAAIGHGNLVNQNIDQSSGQFQTDVNGYYWGY
jgi:opacity protein-like surface antigen